MNNRSHRKNNCNRIINWRYITQEKNSLFRNILRDIFYSRLFSRCSSTFSTIIHFPLRLIKKLNVMIHFRVMFRYGIWNSACYTETFIAISFIISLDLANTRNRRFLPDLLVIVTLIMRRIARPRFYSSPRFVS